ncbi:MAG: hypothetical protein R3C68_18520 [Myxococcota bacterium]
MAIDPGLRTGCKCVVLDATGSFCRQANPVSVPRRCC